MSWNGKVLKSRERQGETAKTPADYSFTQAVDYNVSLTRLSFMNNTWSAAKIGFAGWEIVYSLEEVLTQTSEATWSCPLIRISTQLYLHVSGHFRFSEVHVMCVRGRFLICSSVHLLWIEEKIILLVVFHVHACFLQTNQELKAWSHMNWTGNSWLNRFGLWQKVMQHVTAAYVYLSSLVLKSLWGKKGKL